MPPNVSRTSPNAEAAINALSLLDDTDCWLDLTDPWLKQHGPAATGGRGQQRPRLLFGGGGGGQQPGEEEEVEDGGEEAGAGPEPPPPLALLLPEEPVLTLQQLRREYLLLRCTLAVAENLPGTWHAAWGQ